MKILIFLIALLSGLFNCSSTQTVYDKEKKGELILKIDDLSSGNGFIRMIVFDEDGKEGYPGDSRSSVYACILPANISEEMVIQISDLPYGRYAIIYMHDENANAEFDLLLPKKEWLFFLPNWPVEGYGYSNVNRPSIGTPKFESASFILDKDSKTFELYTSYFWRRYGILSIALIN
ncbi:MAG: DUF2141 domain-containing protein, partial [Leptospiraceae bacterium]|nr:DUF2141 domain-containing protein [Leptospiraceae bacterium]